MTKRSVFGVKYRVVRVKIMSKLRAPHILGAGCISALAFALFAPVVPFSLMLNCPPGSAQLEGVQLGCPQFTYLNGFNSVAYSLLHFGASYSFQLGYQTNLLFAGGGANAASLLFFLLPMVTVVTYLLRHEVVPHRSGKTKR